MKRLNKLEMMEILDKNVNIAPGEIAEADKVQLDNAKLAMMALQAWEETEPVPVREEFWPKLREQLPERPPRSLTRRVASQLSAWVWPAHSPMMASMRVAMLAAILALASFWFAPQRAVTPVSASYTAEEKAFIQRSLQKHDNYVATQPVSGLEIPAGDAQSAQIGNGDPVAEYLP